jgi:Cu(I)/Ag(I) efflux system membrane fusion protein
MAIMQKIKAYMKSKKISILMITAAGVLVGLIYVFGVLDPDAGQIEGPEGAAMEPMPNDGSGPTSFVLFDDQDKAVYTCPMYCVPPMQKPGKCPVCGMDLVGMPLGEYHHREGPPIIRFSAEAVKSAGIQVAAVERKMVTKAIRLFGKIEYDPVEQFKVTAFAPGVIDRIYVKRAGQSVRAGDPLFDMHSSELFVLEQDLFVELKHFPDAVDDRPARGQIYKRQMRPPRRQFNLPKAGEAPEAEVAAKRAAMEKLPQIQRKMMLLGLSKNDIDTVMARGLPSGISTVITPTTGIVQQQLAFKGSYVNTGETVFTIANPKYVWARLDGYASDFPWIRLGQEAEFRVDAYPEETFKGKVQYLDPEFDPQTRTFKVGVLYTDSRKRLKPNMLVRCVIRSRMTAGGVTASGGKVKEAPPLVIPDTAPLVTGNRAVVYVEVPGQPGTYEGREVVLGPRARDYYVVKHGLQAGDKVVVNGSFKIDSAVQILAKPSMMEPHGAKWLPCTNITLEHRP